MFEFNNRIPPRPPALNRSGFGKTKGASPGVPRGSRNKRKKKYDAGPRFPSVESPQFFSKPPRFAPLGWRNSFSVLLSNRGNFFPPTQSGPTQPYNSCEAERGKTRPDIPSKGPGGAPSRARLELFRRGPRRGKKFPSGPQTGVRKRQ